MCHLLTLYKKIFLKRLFEDMAIGVLSIFDDCSVDLINGVILLQIIPYYKLNCLEMASEAKSQKFIALPSGKIFSKIKRMFFEPFFILSNFSTKIANWNLVW